MTDLFSNATLLIWIGGGAVAIGAGLVGASFGARDSALARAHARHIATLNRKLRLLFLPERGASIVAGQLVAALLQTCATLVLKLPLFPFWVLLIAVSPTLYLKVAHKRRVDRLETQVDGFVLAFANALKTVPSPSAALQAVVPMLAQPTRQEVERVLKEMRVGSTLDQALVAMSARIKSKPLDTAYSAVLVGLRVGGNLPAVLERTALAIREMNRLHGVIRAKTGEGRMQLWFMGFFPALIIALFHMVAPGYFDPLQTTFIGQLVSGVAGTLWLTSFFVARKILAVDI